jgi:hypothetical protein
LRLVSGWRYYDRLPAILDVVHGMAGTLVQHQSKLLSGDATATEYNIIATKDYAGAAGLPYRDRLAHHSPLPLRAVDSLSFSISSFHRSIAPSREPSTPQR